MKETFFNSMFSDGGKISHKRWISVTCSAVICFVSVWATVKYPQYITDILHSLLVFVAVMSGVATVAQIVALVKGTPLPKEPEGPVNGESLPPGGPGGNPPGGGS